MGDVTRVTGSSGSPRSPLVLEQVSPLPSRFRLGDAVLALDGDSALERRFSAILGDCATGNAHPDLPCVSVSVRSDRAALAYPGPRLDLGGFLSGLMGAAALPVSDDAVLLGKATEWRGQVANLAINVAMAIQPGVMFFHAGSVSLSGRGIMIVGPKGAGKSTLSLALAARGHQILGDELAAVRVSTEELLPVPRACSIRPGARSELISRRIEELDPEHETLPDGSIRHRVRLTTLFPGIEFSPAPLDAVIFLRSFAAEPRLERFAPTQEDSRLLQTLGAGLFPPDPMRAFRLLRILTSNPAYHLDVGSPEATSALIERTMEESCH